MSTSTMVMSPAATSTGSTAHACEECSTELHLIGTGALRYWSCRYCGTALPAL